MVETAFDKALENVKNKKVLGKEVEEFILHMDWADGFGGYLLEAQRKNKQLDLVDLGSKVVKGSSSSYLGELEALKWGLESTKGMRGDWQTTVHYDNKGLVDAWKTPLFHFNDIRIAHWWGWILENEPKLKIEFIPGEKNTVAD